VRDRGIAGPPCRGIVSSRSREPAELRACTTTSDIRCQGHLRSKLVNRASIGACFRCRRLPTALRKLAITAVGGQAGQQDAPA
jgi:hypothetical protein